VRGFVCSRMEVGLVLERDQIARRVGLRAELLRSLRGGATDLDADARDVVTAEGALDRRGERQRSRRGLDTTRGDRLRAWVHGAARARALALDGRANGRRRYRANGARGGGRCRRRGAAGEARGGCRVAE